MLPVSSTDWTTCAMFVGRRRRHRHCRRATGGLRVRSKRPEEWSVVVPDPPSLIRSRRLPQSSARQIYASLCKLCIEVLLHEHPGQQGRIRAHPLPRFLLTPVSARRVRSDRCLRFNHRHVHVRAISANFFGQSAAQWHKFHIDSFSARPTFSVSDKPTSAQCNRLLDLTIMV